jgi:hypothetical protein|tara:strand:+ start:626 stop:1639 length:1014 start_codon:yes stop_codon:yes gene_type:complete
MSKEENNTEIMDFILNDVETYDNGLSHPSVEFEENERKEADRITMEKEIDYKCCERFYGNEKLVCDNIRKLGSWLGDYDGLNMKDIVNKLLEDDKQCEDMNPKYQKPMGYLYKTGIVKDIIKKSDGTYYTKKLNNCCLVKDENGEWDYVNKLNTNYNDLSELLTTLFLKGGKIDELTKLNVAEIKSYLLNLRKNNVLLKLFMKYFTIDEYRDFTYNTKGNTVRGDYVEDLTKQMLEKEGYTTLYEGGNGDFIDMKYGVDLIVEKDGDISLVQVKSRAVTAKYSTTKDSYRYINIFAGESPDGNGITMYHRENGVITVSTIGKDVLNSNMEYLKKRYS